MSGTDATAAPADGRRARGERRRAELLDATLRVVRRDGAAGVTHRTVAAEAGVTTSLTTYHFATLDDLLVAALTTVAEGYAADVDAILAANDDPLTGLAALLAASASEAGRGRALAERELVTLAARRAALRPLARHWRSTAARLFGRYTADPTAIAAGVAASDGLCAAILLSGEEPDVAQVRAVLAQAVGVDDRSDA